MSDIPDLPYDGRRKLTSAQVDEMRSLAGTMTQVELAKRFGVSQPQVSCILRGQARTNTQNLTPYRQGWLAGVRFAADTARKAAAKPSFADKPAPEVLIEMSEGLALGASMRETEWEADQ